MVSRAGKMNVPGSYFGKNIAEIESIISTSAKTNSKYFTMI